MLGLERGIGYDYYPESACTRAPFASILLIPTAVYLLTFCTAE